MRYNQLGNTGLFVSELWRLVRDGQTVLIYCPQRRSVEPYAEVIVDLHERSALPSLLAVDAAALQTAISLREEWLGPNSDILKCLRLGVALHHGALPTAYRKEIERLLREGVLKVTISSPKAGHYVSNGDGLDDLTLSRDRASS